jgi:anti-sigma regulatory factor (Ser/Thr protein kinase)
LKQFDTTNVLLLHFTDKENLWIATSAVSLYHYNISANSMAEAEEYRKYKANGIFDMRSDSAGNIYTGTKKGMVILFKSGRTKAIAQQEGLIANWAEGLLLDKHNRMWIGNDFGVVCYNPADSGIRTFDERFGLSIYGITIGAYYQMPNGEFVFGTPKGIEYFQPDSLYNKKINLSVSVNKIETRQVLSNITSSTTFNLSPSDNLVTFYFGTVDFNKYIRIYYQYKLEGVDKDWINIADQNSVRYNSIPAGKYIFKVRVSNDGKNWQDAENEVTIIIAKAIYQQVWFKIIGLLFGIFLIGYIVRFYRKKQELQKKELINKQKLTESRLQSLRLQMNPHFLFNALNSIQQMILANEEMVATKYLSRFSKLLRTVLVHSDKENVSLKEEIDILKMYVELESVRFKESFTYTITCDEEIETEEIKIPTLLIQPFVENAIWHGLMHKEGNRHLNISFTEKQDFLQCIIEDNGVGRKKATEIKTSTGQDKKHTGKGIAVSEERLRTMKNSSGRPGTIQINDLTNAGGEGAGTQVIINFPIQN